MQHNKEQANAPDLPPELLTKIAGITKIIGMEDPSAMPSPEPNCNCFHCQIARAMRGKKKEDEEEIVTDADLQFRTWEIEHKEKNLYLVTNPLDDKEHYNVFLGDPIGCTCGEKNCEHIRAVLQS